MDFDKKNTCPVCGGDDWTYAMNAHGLAYFSCDTCLLSKLHPRPSEKKVKHIYKGTAFNDSDIGEPSDTIIERAEVYWEKLKESSNIDPEKSKILVISHESRSVVEVGEEMGFKNIYSEETLESMSDSIFDAALMILALEKMENPIEVLGFVHEAMKPGGIFVIASPMLDSWPAHFFRDAWIELRPENLFFFSTQNIQSVLLETGFHRIGLFPNRPRYTLQHIYSRACIYPRTRLTRLLRRFLKFIPENILRKIRVRVPSSAYIITATKVKPHEEKLLSIVMPVYNEVNTFEECFNKVLYKEIKGINKEIIVVESNSTDGTRELVQEICVQDNVSVVSQDNARGKGYAVRAGLQVARGDIVLIQDADLEYDVDDYDALLNPILNHKALFVLGSRHSGRWKMREFNDQPVLASLFNFGHLIFRGLLNIIYGQSLKDPFTMYKVFRTDCQYGLDFQCNRFDFDFEIVIKLILKGYKPLEVPVNYKARSFTEGKKVSTLRDPLTWLRALVQFRFYKVDLLSVAEKDRKNGNF